MKKECCSDAERMIMDAVTEIQAAKRDDRRVPDYATLDEIVSYSHIERDEVLRILRSLYKGGCVEHRRTVNGILMFGIKETG